MNSGLSRSDRTDEMESTSGKFRIAVTDPGSPINFPEEDFWPRPFRILGEQRGVRTWDDVSKSKNSAEFDVEFGIEYPPASLESPHA